MKNLKNKRSLLTMSLAEGIQILLLGETHISHTEKIEMRKKTQEYGSKEFLQFYYLFTPAGQQNREEIILMNVSDDPRGQISLCKGNEYFRTHYKITKFLELQGFDLPELEELEPVLTQRERKIYNRMIPGEEYQLDDICHTTSDVGALESLRTKMTINIDANKHGTYYKLVDCIRYSLRI